MPDVPSPAERDLILLISYMCCSLDLRDAVCETLADFLEVNAFRDEFSKAERKVEEEGRVLARLSRKIPKKIASLRAKQGITHHDVEAEAAAWLKNEVQAARVRRLDGVEP